MRRLLALFVVGLLLPASALAQSGFGGMLMAVPFVPPPPPPVVTLPPLANGTYVITLGANSVDGGFGEWGAPYVEFWATNSGTGQQWVWNGTTFSNVYIAASSNAVASGPLLADGGNSEPTENSSGDTWSAIPSGSGYKLLDNRTGLYLSSGTDANTAGLVMSSTQTVWTMTNLSGPPVPTALVFTPSSPNVPDTSTSGTSVTAITVTMSDGSTFHGLFSLDSTSFYSLSGVTTSTANLVLSHTLSSSDDGTHSVNVTATQN
jgi:hypothetical protein